MPAVNISVRQTVGKNNGHLLFGVIVVDAFGRKDNTTVLQVKISVVAQQRILNGGCHRRGKLLLSGIGCHGNSLGNIINLDIKDVLFRFAVFKGVVQLAKRTLLDFHGFCDHQILLLLASIEARDILCRDFHPATS